MDPLKQLFFDMGISVLISTVKNAESRKTLKRAFLKVFKEIWTQFKSDADFQAVVEGE